MISSTAQRIYGFKSKCGTKVTVAGNDATEYKGFHVEAAGTGNWTVTFIDGGTYTFAPVSGQQYDWHVSAINTTGVTSPAYVGFL